MRFWGPCGCAIALATLAACATLPPRPDAAPGRAEPAADHGPLHDTAELVSAQLAPKESAHWLLDRNELAFTARLALTDSAVSTLDVQYFIWQEDATGYLLAGRLLDAADRGVKIRLLLDDFSVTTRNEELLRLDAHPSIEVRLFNPWAARGGSAAKLGELVRRLSELNPRMHNKTYIADGHLAIVGGRNIGDRYFGLYAPFVQNDLDVLLEGPIVDDVEKSFDVFWNSTLTYPAASFYTPPEPAAVVATARAEIGGAVAAAGELLQAFPPRAAGWDEYLSSLTADFAKGRDVLYYDGPELRDPVRMRLAPRLLSFIAGAQHDVLISAPYFIPDEDLRNLLRTLVARGVRVRVITNSLATNNHVVAHTGYKKWRREVLAAGVELYELRADAESLALYITPPATAAALGLHTKAIVVDGERTFIGSPNIDPRSLVLNTELGIATESPDLARRLGDLIERDMAPQNAWRVTMDAEGWLTWTSGSEQVRRQPAKGFRQRTIEFLLNLLPLKKQG
ncbi:MAG TPA: phospholipase D family protein [Gammaproteobacteria bacterium]|nr:phospholipase D family protein [Gammaproteobacteria bacterium]